MAGIVLLASIWAACAAPLPGLAERAFVSVATGAVSGVYYPTGDAICRIVNASAQKSVLRCSVEATPGSVYNIEALATGEEDFAIVQSDVQSLAVNGQLRWQGRPLTDLRAVMSLYPEVLTIIARPEAGISNIDGLKGKRVNIGAPGSGTRATWDELEEALGLSADDLAEAAELKQNSAMDRLCSGDLDASLMVVGHPSRQVASELARCGLVLVDGRGAGTDALIAAKPYFVNAVIPAATYGLPRDIRTFGIEATIVTRRDEPDAVVYAFTRAVLEGLAKLKGDQPVLAGMVPTDMATLSQTAPLHPGAERAYREFGLLK
jgi:TRAP transporter TAXI family solute receptor